MNLGGEGNDWMDGGDGADTLIGEAGYAAIYLNGNDTFTSSGGQRQRRLNAAARRTATRRKAYYFRQIARMKRVA